MQSTNGQDRQTRVIPLCNSYALSKYSVCTDAQADLNLSILHLFPLLMAGPRSAIGRALDSEVRGPWVDTRSGNILSFLLPLFQEGQ